MSPVVPCHPWCLVTRGAVPLLTCPGPASPPRPLCFPLRAVSGLSLPGAEFSLGIDGWWGRCPRCGRPTRLSLCARRMTHPGLRSRGVPESSSRPAVPPGRLPRLRAERTLPRTLSRGAEAPSILLGSHETLQPAQTSRPNTFLSLLRCGFAGSNLGSANAWSPRDCQGDRGGVLPCLPHTSALAGPPPASALLALSHVPCSVSCRAGQRALVSLDLLVLAC